MDSFKIKATIWKHGSGHCIKIPAYIVKTFDKKVGDVITVLYKENKIQNKLRRNGNSYVITFPSNIIKRDQLKADDVVVVTFKINEINLFEEE